MSKARIINIRKGLSREISRKGKLFHLKVKLFRITLND